MESARVLVSDDAGALAWFDSPGGGERAFCTRCGSSLFFKSRQWPGELHIARALFAEPVDRESRAHVYYESHVTWVPVADDLPKSPNPATQKPRRASAD